ncbi:MAG: monovalent cation/H+ antiporter complex subunit F [Ideonella sp.]|jgi:multicomponent Na+:H+ antiporter subunit F|nr:monovalent cation/H+ antiporter complex subunit F [Ideonella sp.]
MIAWATLLLVLAALLSAGLAIWRLLRGPTHADRIVALDIFLAAALALCIAASLATGRTVFIDVGVGLALVGFVATLGWARLLERAPAPRPDPKAPRGSA